MGNKVSPTQTSSDASKEIFALQQEFERTTSIPMEVIVAHYTPSGFPLIPIINKKTATLCREAWVKIVSGSSDGKFEQHEHTISPPISSGIIAFYCEFYERLEALDGSGKFEAVLSRHAGSKNRSAAKGEILIRIIKFVLAIECDSKEVQLSLYMLGRSHAQKNIRPWQYSVFVQALLYTISSRLGHDATHEVMEAWVNMFAFVLKSMLPNAIRGQIVENEIAINTSSVFADEYLAAEVNEAEEVKKKRFQRMQSVTEGSGGPNYHFPMPGEGSYYQPASPVENNGDYSQQQNSSSNLIPSGDGNYYNNNNNGNAVVPSDPTAGRVQKPFVPHQPTQQQQQQQQHRVYTAPKEYPKF